MTHWKPVISNFIAKTTKKKAVRGIHSCHFSKETLIIPVKQLVLVFNPWPFDVDREMDVVGAAARSLAHSMNHLIHNLHIYLRVNICETETGHFCEFCCNIAWLHRNMGQPPTPSWCSWVLCAHCWSVSHHTGNTGRSLSVGQAPAFNVSTTSCSPAIRLIKHSGAPFFLGEMPLYTLLSLGGITVDDRKLQLSENRFLKHKQPRLRIHPDCSNDI